MLRRSGLGLLVAATLGVIMLGSIAGARSAAAQGASGFDGEYTGTLTLVEVIWATALLRRLGQLSVERIRGAGKLCLRPAVRHRPTGNVAPDGTFQASAPTSLGPIKMTGQIKGNQVNAQIVSPSCLYNFAPAGLSLTPDSPDGLGRQDRRPRKCWKNCQFLLSPVGSVRIWLLDPA